MYLKQIGRTHTSTTKPASDSYAITWIIASLPPSTTRTNYQKLTTTGGISLSAKIDNSERRKDSPNITDLDDGFPQALVGSQTTDFQGVEVEAVVEAVVEVMLQAEEAEDTPLLVAREEGLLVVVVVVGQLQRAL
jgi:hypothetical protein